MMRCCLVGENERGRWESRGCSHRTDHDLETVLLRDRLRARSHRERQMTIYIVDHGKRDHDLSIHQTRQITV